MSLNCRHQITEPVIDSEGLRWKERVLFPGKKVISAREIGQLQGRHRAEFKHPTANYKGEPTTINAALGIAALSPRESRRHNSVSHVRASILWYTRATGPSQ
jgi:hypothetical protein